MTEIWAQWQNGEVECIDSAESESEAINLVVEYQMAYGVSATHIWLQKERFNNVETINTMLGKGSDCL